ncbi:hypothetical protein JTE90_007189 [Oedothorax gibbosus]|uniref:Uncharacterized protein n=1 Tax=Oedothorax gibbosus TaxID=931172 RepID=A0AAV6TF95_9ARAC|nr:hypothetical protein JTE90_007189 [Oedothorax gibbosus]
MCASQWLNKPRGGNEKSGPGGGRPHSGSVPRGGGAPGDPAFSPCGKWGSLSGPVGNRKMVKFCRQDEPEEKIGGGFPSGSDVQIDRQIWV